MRLIQRILQLFWDGSRLIGLFKLFTELIRPLDNDSRSSILTSGMLERWVCLLMTKEELISLSMKW